MPSQTAHSYEVETPAGTFPSFAEAAEAGYPVACGYFALCENAAEGAIPHPVLDAVPACRRCIDRYEAMA